MTLGEFRKITEHLTDDCELTRTGSSSDINYTYGVDLVYIKHIGSSEGSAEPKTKTSVVFV